MQPKTRIPVQQRSIEKRQRIIIEGFSLMCKDGYHNVTTPMIAKAANVATGSVYSYFENKMDIFLAGISMFGESIKEPVLDAIKKSDGNLRNLITTIIDSTIEKHQNNQNITLEIIKMQAEDQRIIELFSEYNDQLLKAAIIELKPILGDQDNLYEKLYIILQLVENFSHDYTIHPTNNINYDVTKKITINAILDIIEYDNI